MHAVAIDKPVGPGAGTTVRHPVAIRFSIDGDLRYISHRDELRLLARALQRAGWPVAYSQGFNPQPRRVLPLPRSVGTASTCEWAVVELSERCPTGPLYRSLAAALPAGCRLQRVVALTNRAKPQPRRTVYDIELEAEHAVQAGPRIAGLLAAERLDVERTYGPGKPPRAINIRPYIETVTLGDRTLSMRLTFVRQRTARPTEVLTKLRLPADAYKHRVRRVEVEWNIGLAGQAAWPASPERNNVGQEESCNEQRQQEYEA
jgi:radical SAM-linked protein